MPATNWDQDQALTGTSTAH